MSDFISSGGWPEPARSGGATPNGPAGASDPRWSWGPPPLASSAVHAATWSSTGPAGPPRRTRRSIRSLLSAAGVLTVVAVILPIVGSTSTAGAAEVVAAARQTASQQTAQLDLSGSVTADGQSVTIGGSGSVDFSQHQESVTANVSADGVNESVSELVVGGTMYESVPGISTLEPGKSWISAAISTMEKAAGSSSPLSGIDPAADIALLEQQGATVSPLGSSMIDGVEVTGYQVDVSNSVIQSELQTLPSWARQAMSSVDVSGLTLNVYIDGANEFRRFSVSTQITAAGQSVSVNMNEDFSQYGQPVSIAAPPSDEVVSLQQFLQDSGASTGS